VQSADLKVKLTGARLDVTINRPEKRNALSKSVLEAIRAAFADHAGDDRIGLAVISGTGEKAFAAGGDLGELQSVLTLAEACAMAEHGKGALDAVRDFPAPVVAALNGAALGGGAELALACDLRIAAYHAKLGFIQAKLGITPAWGGAVDLFDKAGYSLAMRLLMRAEVLSAEEALRLGLVDAIAAEGQPLKTALDAFTEPMIRREAHVLRAIKSQAIASRHESRAARKQLETAHLSQLWVHPAHWEAANSALGRQT
jgi:enoyl-CoA hydratase